MNKDKTREAKRTRRRARIRARIKGTAKCPRLSIFKSNRYLYVQLIDDESGRTILSADSRDVKIKSDKKSGMSKKGKKAEAATSNPYFSAGQLLAEQAKGKKINRVVFDRGGYKYHGQVKALAEGARAGGLKF